jgi:hypothetical protein
MARDTTFQTGEQSLEEALDQGTRERVQTRIKQSQRENTKYGDKLDASGGDC